jgi:protein-arginine kinase activator protein McsA
MKCDFCECEANNFLTMIVDGNMTEAKLCEKCAKEKGIADPAGFQQFSSFLLGTAAHQGHEGFTNEESPLMSGLKRYDHRKPG